MILTTILTLDNTKHDVFYFIFSVSTKVLAFLLCFSINENIMLLICKIDDVFTLMN